MEPVLLPGQAERNERADELEAERAELGAHGRAIRPEVAGRAELDRREAERAHVGEQRRRRDKVVTLDRALPHTPRDRRGGDPARAHFTAPSVSPRTR